ncbi:MAG: CotH kinase family protein [Draconibacterium sp.]
MNYTVYRYLLFFLFILPLDTYSSVSFTTGDSLLLSMSHSQNFYNSGFYLEIKVNHPEAVVKFTLDCSTPSIQNGEIFQSPVFIDSTCVIKAFAYSVTDTSEIITQTFIFPESVKKQGRVPTGFPMVWGGSTSIGADYAMDKDVTMNPVYSGEFEQALKSLPVVSLSMSVDDWFNSQTGLYVGYPNSDISREKAVTAEFLFSDTTQNFAVNCGVQNQGGTSIINWKVPKQSMRLLFKEKYGPKKLKKKLFPDAEIESINTLVLDGFLYSWLHPWDEKQRVTTLFFRDQLASDMQNKMGWPSFHGIYVHLFINGLYWGMYDLHERPDEEFLAEYLFAQPEDFDIIKHNPKTIVQGSNATYLEMLEFARKGLSTQAALKKMEQYLDLPAFIDYMILNFYLGNFDWAHQNYYAARNKIQGTGFRFYTWDAEHVMRYSELEYNNINKSDEGGPTEIHTHLKKNAEYRIMFADAVYRHFFNEGVLTPESFRESFVNRKNEIEKAVILESARWGDYLENTVNVTYTRDEHWTPEVNRVLAEYIPNRRDVVLRQLKADFSGLFPAVMPPLFFEQPGSNPLLSTIEISNPNNGGTIYFTLDGSDPRAVGGAINGIKYTKKLEVQNGSFLKSRVLADDKKTWSALAEKAVQQTGVYGESLEISEIMYHPAEGFPEFIEIMNTGKTTAVLDGFNFFEGISFDFKTGTRLFPGEGIVLTNDTLLFRDKYGFGAFGQFNKQLDNAGEVLVFQNRYGQVIDSVAFSDSLPWPVNADGSGSSIEIIDSGSDNSVASNWKVSATINGTPFQMQTVTEQEPIFYPNPFSDKVFVDFLNPDLAYKSFRTEIYNLTGSLIKSVESYGNGTVIEIPMNDVTQGIYVFKISLTNNSEFRLVPFKAVKVNR